MRIKDCKTMHDVNKERSRLHDDGHWIDFDGACLYAISNDRQERQDRTDMSDKYTGEELQGFFVATEQKITVNVINQHARQADLKGCRMFSPCGKKLDNGRYCDREPGHEEPCEAHEWEHL